MALGVGRGVAALSRRLGRGRGTVVGGHAALLVDPRSLSRLARDREVVLVTGTNGKTTTTAMLGAMLAGQGAPVACNSTGANMPAGLVTALLDAPTARHAVLEVDEGYLDAVVATVDPRVLVLLNLSTEFTRGVSLAKTRSVLKRAISHLDPDAVVVANCDDPQMVDLVAGHRVVTWVSDGQQLTAPATLAGEVAGQACPRCGSLLSATATTSATGSSTTTATGNSTGAVDRTWCCPGCGLARPEPVWQVQGTYLVREGQRAHLDGLDAAPWLRSNAAFAVAAAAAVGVPPAAAAERAAAAGDVDGRYRLYDLHGRRIRVAMWKNPASLQLALGCVPHEESLVVMTDRFGVKDTVSWWDIDLSDWAHPQPVLVTGGRALDVAARLEASEIAFEVVEDPMAAFLRCRRGRVAVVANYPAHLRIKRILSRSAVR